MPTVKSIRGLLNLVAELPEEIRRYFEHLPGLVNQFPLDVALAYTFSRLELAHNMALYCGAVRIHKCHAEIAYMAIQAHQKGRVA